MIGQTLIVITTIGNKEIIKFMETIKSILVFILIIAVFFGLPTLMYLVIANNLKNPIVIIPFVIFCFLSIIGIFGKINYRNPFN